MRTNSVTRSFGRRLWRDWFRTAIGCALALLVSPPAGLAQTQSGYPSKPVRLLVPYGAGGVGDQTMRLLANSLSQQVKQQIVIENRPSAGGIISMTEVLRAPADGYTLGEMGNGQAISMSLFSNLRYDLLRDFSPISVAASFAMLLAVPDRSPYKSLEQLVEAARKSPGKLNLGAINPGSTQNLSAHLFKQITGANFTIIPYRTAPDLVTALLRGDVDLGFDYYATFQSVIGPDRLRIIATAGENRDPLLTGVPTAKESGFASVRGHQLERDRRPRGRTGGDHQLPQRRNQPQLGQSGYPGKISSARDRSERKYAGRDVGPNGPGQPQMARGDRESRHPEAIASRWTRYWHGRNDDCCGPRCPFAARSELVMDRRIE